MIAAKPLLLTLATIAATSNVYADDSYLAGQAAVAQNSYGEALVHFRQAAALGHRQAQLVAGGMLLYCEQLYGAEVPCDRAEAVKWLTLAAAQGSEVSRYLLAHARP